MIKYFWLYSEYWPFTVFCPQPKSEQNYMEFLTAALFQPQMDWILAMDEIISTDKKCRRFTQPFTTWAGNFRRNMKNIHPLFPGYWYIKQCHICLRVKRLTQWLFHIIFMFPTLVNNVHVTTAKLYFKLRLLHPYHYTLFIHISLGHMGKSHCI